MNLGCNALGCSLTALDGGYCSYHQTFTRPAPAAEAKASPTYYLRTYERGNVGNPCHYCGADRPQHGEDLRCPPRAADPSPSLDVMGAQPVQLEVNRRLSQKADALAGGRGGGVPTEGHLRNEQRRGHRVSGKRNPSLAARNRGSAGPHTGA